MCFELRHVFVSYLVTMSMPFVDLQFAVQAAGQRAWNQVATLLAKPHGPAEVLITVALLDLTILFRPFADQGNDWIRRVGVDFGRMGAFETDHVARAIDDRRMQAVTDAKIRHTVLAGILRGFDLAFEAALPEPTRHQDCMHIIERAGAVGFDVFGVQKLDVHLGLGLNTRVSDRLDERLVRVEQIQVLTDDCNSNLVFGMQLCLDNGVPFRQIGIRAVESELFHDNVVELLLMQHRGNVVDRLGVRTGDHRALFHVGEQSDLLASRHRQRTVGTADQNVR